MQLLDDLSFGPNISPAIHSSISFVLLASPFNAHRPQTKAEEKTIDQTGTATIPIAANTKFTFLSLLQSSS
jgi:hypothetical protein